MAFTKSRQDRGPHAAGQTRYAREADGGLGCGGRRVETMRTPRRHPALAAIAATRLRGSSPRSPQRARPLCKPGTSLALTTHCLAAVAVSVSAGTYKPDMRHTWTRRAHGSPDRCVTDVHGAVWRPSHTGSSGPGKLATGDDTAPGDGIGGSARPSRAANSKAPVRLHRPSNWSGYHRCGIPRRPQQLGRTGDVVEMGVEDGGPSRPLQGHRRGQGCPRRLRRSTVGRLRRRLPNRVPSRCPLSRTWPRSSRSHGGAGSCTRPGPS